MNTLESLNYAQGRLAMSRAMCDHPEIEKWREHVEYWQSKLAAEEADRANEVVCKTCNGIKYIPATKSTPDKQCPECKGRGLTQPAPDAGDSASFLNLFYPIFNLLNKARRNPPQRR